MYKTEQELLDAGFVKTPEVAHTGKGDGKVYEKIDSSFDGDTQVDTRSYFVVLPDGSVDVYLPGVGIKAEVIAEPVVEAPVAPVEAPVEPEVAPAVDTTVEVQPEAQPADTVTEPAPTPDAVVVAPEAQE